MRSQIGANTDTAKTCLYLLFPDLVSSYDCKGDVHGYIHQATSLTIRWWSRGVRFLPSVDVLQHVCQILQDYQKPKSPMKWKNTHMSNLKLNTFLWLCIRVKCHISCDPLLQDPAGVLVVLHHPHFSGRQHLLEKGECEHVRVGSSERLCGIRRIMEQWNIVL